jgi:hypothetical protein
VAVAGEMSVLRWSLRQLRCVATLKGTFPVGRVNVERHAGVQFGQLVDYLVDRAEQFKHVFTF